jgi:hypothetical protein
MSAVLTRDDRATLRQKIDDLERLHDIIGVIEDVEATEFGDRKPRECRVTVADKDGTPIATGYAMPHDVVLIGLRAMRDALQATAQHTPLERAVNARRDREVTA